MKLAIERAALLRSLAHVQSVVERRTTIPILSNVKLDATKDGLGVLVITHYSRLLNELRPDHVHVLAQGRIVTSGGPELADALEESGYGRFGVDEEAGAETGAASAAADPFADPLA